MAASGATGAVPMRSRYGRPLTLAAAYRTRSLGCGARIRCAPWEVSPCLCLRLRARRATAPTCCAAGGRPPAGGSPWRTPVRGSARASPGRTPSWRIWKRRWMASERAGPAPWTGAADVPGADGRTKRTKRGWAMTRKPRRADTDRRPLGSLRAQQAAAAGAGPSRRGGGAPGPAPTPARPRGAVSAPPSCGMDGAPAGAGPGEHGGSRSAAPYGVRQPAAPRSRRPEGSMAVMAEASEALVRTFFATVDREGMRAGSFRETVAGMTARDARRRP